MWMLSRFKILMVCDILKMIGFKPKTFKHVFSSSIFLKHLILFTGQNGNDPNCLSLLKLYQPYEYTRSLVQSPDGDTDFFDIKAGVFAKRHTCATSFHNHP